MKLKNINVYEPDYNAPDQGAATGTSNRTIYDFVDAIGATKNATIRLRHNSGGNTTTYTITTSGTTSDNIKLEIDIGAILSDGGGGADFVIGQMDPVTYKVFDWTGSGAVTFNNGAISIIYSEMFGATGDGITDDYTPITQAINSLPSSGGAIELLNAKYLFGTKIVINKNMTLKGQGAIQTNNTDAPTTLLKDNALNDTGIEITAVSAQLQEFLLDGESGNGGDGILVNAARVKLRDIAVFKMGQDGIRVGGSNNTNLWSIENSYTKNNGRHGVFVKSTTGTIDANAGKLIGLDTQSNTGNGLKVEDAYLSTFINVTTQTNTAEGVLLATGSKKNFFYGCNIDEANNSGGDQLTIDVGAEYNMFLGCVTGAYTNNGTKTLILNHIGDFRETGWRFFDGVTIGAGQRIDTHLSVTTTWDPGSIASAGFEAKTVTVTGATTADTCTASLTTLGGNNYVISAHIQSANTARVVLFNPTGGALDAASGTLRIDVWQH